MCGRVSLTSHVQHEDHSNTYFFNRRSIPSNLHRSNAECGIMVDEFEMIDDHRPSTTFKRSSDFQVLF